MEQAMDAGMNKVMETFKSSKMALMASLPDNRIDLAVAARAGGADMLKIHLNVEHAASGTVFGSFEREKDRIRAIIDAAGIPVGVMPGAAAVATVDEMHQLAEMGVCFYDIYASDMPAEYLAISGLAAMAALGTDWTAGQARALSTLKVPLLEASIVKHEFYGSRLALSDVMNYAVIAETFGGPVVVPTQKAILPGEVSALRDAGVRGLMIGKIVTGDTASELEAATSSFRKAIEKL